MAPGLSRPVDAIQDFLNCRLELEKRYERIIRGMAYPDSGITNLQNGASYENIRRYLQDLGIVYSRTLGGDNNHFYLPADWLAWMPTAHHENPALMDYADQFLSLQPDAPNAYYATRLPRLFYLWGHAFEFNNNNNWELIDQIGDTLGGKEDTWYATCMEIYEYVQAYNALVFSADSTRVYNPTLHKIWFDVDGTLYFVDPGDTITIA
jgi:hypothetical protein